MASSPKLPKEIEQAKPAKPASVYDSSESIKNDILKEKQSFVGSFLAGEDEKKDKPGFGY